MAIGKKLDELLEKRGMNARELSKKIDVPPSTIYSIIQRNNKKVDIDILLNVADVLGVDVEYFSDKDDVKTIAAHHDSEEWTQEELDEIEAFKQFVKQKRAMK